MITKSNWGGAQRQVFDLATNLSSKNYDVTVALGGNGTLAHRLKELGVKIISIDTLARDIDLRKEYESFKRILHIIHSEKPDVLHLHSPKAGALGALAGRIMRVKKIIYTSHGWPFNERRSLLFKMIFLVGSWATIICAHTTIVLGEREREQVHKWPGARNKCIIIRNGISKPTYLARTKARDFFSTHIGKKITKDTVVIGSIGELIANKGYEFIIQALASLKNTKDFIYVVISDGDDRKKLEKLIKDKELTDKIFLLGYIHNASIYLKGFDIFALPSVKEGLPYVLLEAAKAELPIIASNVGNIAEVIDDMDSGILIKPANIREVEESIRFLIDNKEKRIGLGKKASKKIDSEYSLSTMLDRVKKLYA